MSAQSIAVALEQELAELDWRRRAALDVATDALCRCAEGWAGDLCPTCQIVALLTVPDALLLDVVAARVAAA